MELLGLAAQKTPGAYWSDLRTRNPCHTISKQPDSFLPLFGGKPRHVNQAIEVVAKVFKALDAIETNASLLRI